MGEGAVEVADDQLSLVCAHADAVGAFEGVFFDGGATGVDLNNLVVFGAGEVDVVGF